MIVLYVTTIIETCPEACSLVFFFSTSQYQWTEKLLLSSFNNTLKWKLNVITPCLPLRVTSAPLAALIDLQINLRWARDESAELSFPTKGSKSSFRFPPRRFPPLLNSDANKFGLEQRNSANTDIFLLNKLFLSFELMFVLCVTNIDLYSDLFHNFDLNIL